MVTHLMGADLNNIVKTQRLSDDHVQFLVYQILRGLKACIPHMHKHRQGKKTVQNMAETKFATWVLTVVATNSLSKSQN